MAISANSYGSVAEIVALTRHVLAGSSTYTTSTRPTLAEVERFIDRVSGVLNSALAESGFSVPVSQSTAVLLCTDWVVTKVAQLVELTQPGFGFAEGMGSKKGAGSLYNEACTFVTSNTLGLKRLGATVSHASSEGLAYTGMGISDDRPDRTNTAREQPKFKRGIFDNG
jgi:hypothetical protein